MDSADTNYLGHHFRINRFRVGGVVLRWHPLPARTSRGGILSEYHPVLTWWFPSY